MRLDRNIGWRAHRRLFSTAGFFDVGILWCWHSGDEERARRRQHIAGIREEAHVHHARSIGFANTAWNEDSGSGYSPLHPAKLREDCGRSLGFGL